MLDCLYNIATYVSFNWRFLKPILELLICFLIIFKKQKAAHMLPINDLTALQVPLQVSYLLLELKEINKRPVLYIGHLFGITFIKKKEVVKMKNK